MHQKTIATVVLSLVALSSLLYGVSETENIQNFLSQNLRNVQIPKQNPTVDHMHDNYQHEKIVQPWMLEQCTMVMIQQCAQNVERSVKTCAKAYQAKGKDIIADIHCVKDLLADRKSCWPCICAEAYKRGWKVIGC